MAQYNAEVAAAEEEARRRQEGRGAEGRGGAQERGPSALVKPKEAMALMQEEGYTYVDVRCRAPSSAARGRGLWFF